MRRFVITVIVIIALLGLGRDSILAKTETPCEMPIVLAGYVACADDLPGIDVDPVELLEFTDNIIVEPVANGTGQVDGFRYVHSMAISESRKHHYHGGIWRKRWGPCVAILAADVDVVIVMAGQREWHWRLIDMGSYTIGILRGGPTGPVQIKDLSRLSPLIRYQRQLTGNACMAQRGKPA